MMEFISILSLFPATTVTAAGVAVKVDPSNPLILRIYSKCEYSGTEKSFRLKDFDTNGCRSDLTDEHIMSYKLTSGYEIRFHGFYTWPADFILSITNPKCLGAINSESIGSATIRKSHEKTLCFCHKLLSPASQTWSWTGQSF
ncbi:hypothetical protein K7432_016284 [Basidiobolus ranarum]|uniref:ZP domain-containing protein n=1 Tax=Basidiobolus ranarum TaxID=34480 RepID=A0ABR2WEY3_9FUNG